MSQESIRVRFAPSPTGPLHIGGVRTALYNYLLARKLGGTMILRIEDTDQNRYVSGAEEYIINALTWSGIEIDEGPHKEGDYGPYRQSERGAIYEQFINKLLESGWAYKAYDTQEELESKREQAKASGNHSWQYDSNTRGEMRNSTSLSPNELKDLEDANTPFVVRFKVPKNEKIVFKDIIRGKVEFNTNQLDDKVLFKADGFPTYHMANVIDDHLMKISHVIRGEEWLSSTPLHVLLYKALGWESIMPAFAHLPLILKPQGKGKLSKRDGAKFGFPVFPLTWKDSHSNEEWIGFKETGFLSEGFINLLAFLGWNPGTEKEVYLMSELIQDFSLERVSKSGARFDYEKAKWFNQQHILGMSDLALKEKVKPLLSSIKLTDQQLENIINLYKERVEFLSEIPSQCNYLFSNRFDYDEKAIRKKWKPELTDKMIVLTNQLHQQSMWTAEEIEQTVKTFMEVNALGFGQVLPTLRLAICGTMKGPSIFEIMSLIEKNEVVSRLEKGISLFNQMKQEA